MLTLYISKYLMIVALVNFIPITNANRTQVCLRLVESANEMNTTFHTIDHDRYFSHYIRTVSMWIDKSLLIESIVDDTKSNIFLITSPRKWFKTTNLKMLHSFFDIKVDKEGEKIPLNRTFAYNFFRNGITTSKNQIGKIKPLPLISQREDIINKSMGQFPVIFLKFTEVTVDRNLTLMKEVIKTAFKVHERIFRNIEARNVSEQLKNRVNEFRIMFAGNASSTRELTKDEVINGIQFLSELLYMYYGKKVIILIDDCDYFIRNLYFDLLFAISKHELEIIDFCIKFLQCTLHWNKYLEKAVITTTIPIGAILDIDNAKTIREYDILDADNNLMFFGLTVPEVFDLMKMQDIEDSEKNKVIKWYGGYTCTGSPSGQLVDTASVMSYLKTEKIDEYKSKIKSVTDEFMFKLCKYRDYKSLLISFINNETYVTEYRQFKWISQDDYRAINLLVSKVACNNDGIHKYESKLLSILYRMGYFTIDNTFGNNGRNRTHIRIKVPNEETKQTIQFRMYFKPTSKDWNSHL